MHWRAIARVDRFNKGVLQCKSMPYCLYMWIPFMLEFCLCSLSNSASYVQWIANEKY